MNRRLSIGTGAFVVICCLAFSYSQESNVSGHATGTFEVKMTPQPSDDKGGDATMARMSGEKQFHGDLEGTSKVQMLSWGSPQSSAAYVALEKVTGTLKGRSGSFVLQHTGIMTRGTPQLTITVVPDSGTGQLAGLTGKMNIIIANGKHSYEFDYELPSAL